MAEIKTILEQVSVDQLQKHIQALEGIRHRIIAPQALQKAAAYIQNNLETIGYSVFRQPFTGGVTPVVPQGAEITESNGVGVTGNRFKEVVAVERQVSGGFSHFSFQLSAFQDLSTRCC